MGHALDGFDAAAVIDVLRSQRVRPPLVHAVVVAPDVWDRIKATVPCCRGEAVIAGGIHVFTNPMLAPGTIVPVDADGNPIPRGSKVPLR